MLYFFYFQCFKQLPAVASLCVGGNPGHKEERTDGHLFITVLAYQAVQVIRQKLKSCNINDSWATLRKIFSRQQRVTATFKQKDGRTLHVRKTTIAEPKLQKLYDALRN